MKLIEYILARLSEPSTWRGLIDFATAAGLVLSPEQIEHIIALGLSARAFIGTLLPDNPLRKE